MNWKYKGSILSVLEDFESNFCFDSFGGRTRGRRINQAKREYQELMKALEVTGAWKEIEIPDDEEE